MAGADNDRKPIEVEIPDFKKKEKKGGPLGWFGARGAQGAQGAGSMAGASSGGGALNAAAGTVSRGLAGRLLSGLANLAGGGMGVGLTVAGVAVMGMAGVMTMNAMKDPARIAKKTGPKALLGDVEYKGGEAKSASSLGLVSGANAGAGLFKEAEAAKALAAAQPGASAESASATPAPDAAAPQAAAAPAASSPFGEKKLSAKAIGGLSGGFGNGGKGGMGRFGPAGVSAEGVGGQFKNLDMKGGAVGKVSDKANPMVAARVKRIERQGGEGGGLLARAARLSKQGAQYANSGDMEGASYSASQAFEPGATTDKITGTSADGAGDAGMGETAGMLGDGGAGGGGTGAQAGSFATPTFDPPAAGESTPWTKTLSTLNMLFQICMGLLAVMALFDAFDWFFGIGAAMRAIISGVIAVVAGVIALLASAVSFTHGQSGLGTMWAVLGVGMVAAGIIGIASGAAGSGAGKAAEGAAKLSASQIGMIGGAAGMVNQVFGAEKMGRLGSDTFKADYDKKYGEWKEDFKTKNGREPTNEERLQASERISGEVKDGGSAWF